MGNLAEVPYFVMLPFTAADVNISKLQSLFFALTIFFRHQMALTRNLFRTEYTQATCEHCSLIYFLARSIYLPNMVKLEGHVFTQGDFTFTSIS